MDKQTTDTLILSQASINDNEINQTYFRNTSSVHPRDCICNLCKTLKFSDSFPKAEIDYKTANNWYQGN